MPATRRCREKFLGALHALAVREGDVRERLRGAYFYLRQLEPGQVPAELRDEFESVLDALTRRGPVRDPDGTPYRSALVNTLDQMRNATGRRIAERIFTLARAVDA
jgi:hypothetical protein